MQRRQELIFRETDVSLGPADGCGCGLSLEARHFGGQLGDQNQCEGMFGASVGDGAAVVTRHAAGAVCRDGRSAQRTGTVRRRSPPRRGSWPARPGDHAPPAACRHRGSRGCGFSEGFPAVGAELRTGVVLPAAILASAQCHKVRWPNLLLAASLRHMRLLRAAVFVAATSACAVRNPAPGSRPPTPAAVPLHLTIVYPDTADPIQAQDSSFLFGSVGAGRGDVALSINGFPVRVAPSGSWLAWIPLPSDSVARFQIVARGGPGGEQQETTFVARIAQPFKPP